MAVTLPKTFLNWIHNRAKQLCHRQLLVITGEQEWVKSSIATIRPMLTENCLYAGDSDWQFRCDNSTYRSHLGLEFDNLVYDAFSGLRANSLVALSGTVKSGGLMILLVPPLDNWSEFDDPARPQRTSYGYNNHKSKSNFVLWLINNIQSDSAVCVLSEKGFNGKICEVLDKNKRVDKDNLTTPDQLSAIDSIVANFRRNTTFQLVLTADRGRGKSATLGLAAQRLVDGAEINIGLTAPNRSMTQNVFKHLDINSNITYKPFDELLCLDQKFDLLLVDEAAAIPTAVLKSLVSAYPKIVFSTTTHGYEGSGKGFELRFTPYLQKLNNNLQTCTLKRPVRWFEGDVLEHFWFKSMLMTPHLTQLNNINGNQENLTSRIVYPEELISNSNIFLQIFQLLVNAHYQTTPDDMVRLLDAAELNVHVTTTKNSQVVGVALVSVEGGTKLNDVAIAISEGRRRVKGHLIPQRLAFVRSSDKFAQKKYTRIIRIAVKEEYRRLKIATKLISNITAWSIKNGSDFIGASFGASIEVIKFWQSNNFIPVHLGLKKDASSGEHSLIVLKKCKISASSECSVDIEIDFLSSKFKQELSYQSEYRLSKIDRKIIELLQLGGQDAVKNTEIDRNDEDILVQFANGLRPLYSCEYQLAKFIANHTEQFSPKDPFSIGFLHNLLIIKMSYSQIREKYQLTGKKQIDDHARSCYSNLLLAIKKTQ